VFLNKTPDKKMKQALISLNSEADDFTVNGNHVYNLHRDRDTLIFSNLKKIADKHK